MTRFVVAGTAVFAFLLAFAFVLVRFAGFPTDLLRAVPAAFFLYLALALTLSLLRRRPRPLADKRGPSQ
jgi:hypothetical protein